MQFFYSTLLIYDEISQQSTGWCHSGYYDNDNILKLLLNIVKRTDAWILKNNSLIKILILQATKENFMKGYTLKEFKIW